MKTYKDYYISIFHGIKIYGEQEYETDTNAKKAADILYTAFSTNLTKSKRVEKTLQNSDVEFRLKKLKDLFDKGLLTNQEYKVKREEILREL